MDYEKYRCCPYCGHWLYFNVDLMLWCKICNKGFVIEKLKEVKGD